MPLFSVVIPCYNRRELAKATFESLWRQEFTDFEVIAVDDGSTDGTWESLQAEGRGIKLLRQQNQGPAAARNLAARHATGEYLAFLDSDDLWFPWTLKTYQGIITKYSSPGLIRGADQWFTNPAELASATPGPLEVNVVRDAYATPETNTYGASWIIVRRSLWEAIGGFDPQLQSVEDIDAILRLGVDYRLVIISAPVTFGYRVHPGNLSGDNHKAWIGFEALAAGELAGRFPGGKERQRERRAFIAKTLRPAILAMARGGAVGRAWRLYKTTFPWNWADRRWRFILAAPAILLGRWLAAFAAGFSRSGAEQASKKSVPS